VGGLSDVIILVATHQGEEAGLVECTHVLRRIDDLRNLKWTVASDPRLWGKRFQEVPMKTRRTTRDVAESAETKTLNNRNAEIYL
jgi:hypothetical protein